MEGDDTSSVGNSGTVRTLGSWRCLREEGLRASVCVLPLWVFAFTLQGYALWLLEEAKSGAAALVPTGAFHTAELRAGERPVLQPGPAIYTKVRFQCE